MSIMSVHIIIYINIHASMYILYLQYQFEIRRVRLCACYSPAVHRRGGIILSYIIQEGCWVMDPLDVYIG